MPAPKRNEAPARTLINHPRPTVDGGRYAPKRCVGDTVKVSADIFRDGHEIMRAVVEANRRYLPNLIDLAWNFSRGDLERTVEFIGIKDDAVRLALIRYLFAAKAFSAAFKLWTPAIDAPRPDLFNGGFEDSKILNEPGFGGWFLTPGQSKIKVAIDVSEKFAGTKSLQLNFDGDWAPGTPLISQTVLVDPLKTYRVSFSIKTKELATGGPLMLTVHDADNGELLGKSDNFPSSDSWVTLNFDFTTLETSEAAVIRLKRSNCSSSPCPIFGTVWLDEISIGPAKDARQ
jgi:hypothetical protein